MSTVYKPLFPQKSNLHRAQFAEAALREVFRGRDLSLAREPDFLDRRPHESPPLAGEFLNYLKLIGVEVGR